MKVKRIRLGNGRWRIRVVEKTDFGHTRTLLEWHAVNSGVRLGPNVKAWDYWDEAGRKLGIAFGLRDIERLAINAVRSSICLSA